MERELKNKLDKINESLEDLIFLISVFIIEVAIIGITISLML